MTNKNIYQKLAELQTRIKVGKTHYNSFGKYSYRNLEDIFEAVKPILKELKLSLMVADDIIVAGDRYYVKATAILTDNENSTQIQTSALAREPEIKKGMDLSQITGASSSYARKYTLSGLLLLDDNQDADAPQQTDKPKTNKTTEESKPEKAEEFNKDAFLKILNKTIKDKKLDNNAVKTILEIDGLKTLDDVNDRATGLKIYEQFKNIKVEAVKNIKKETKDDK